MRIPDPTTNWDLRRTFRPPTGSPPELSSSQMCRRISTWIKPRHESSIVCNSRENTNTNFMPEKPPSPKKLSEKNTKQEMIEAYQALAKQLEERRAAELAPERRLEEKRAEEAVKVAVTV